MSCRGVARSLHVARWLAAGYGAVERNRRRLRTLKGVDGGRRRFYLGYCICTGRAIAKNAGSFAGAEDRGVQRIGVVWGNTTVWLVAGEAARAFLWPGALGAHDEREPCVAGFRSGAAWRQWLGCITMYRLASGLRGVDHMDEDAPRWFAVLPGHTTDNGGKVTAATDRPIANRIHRWTKQRSGGVEQRALRGAACTGWPQAVRMQRCPGRIWLGCSAVLAGFSPATRGTRVSRADADRTPAARAGRGGPGSHTDAR